MPAFSACPFCNGGMFSVALSVALPLPAFRWYPLLQGPDFPLGREKTERLPTLPKKPIDVMRFFLFFPPAYWKYVGSDSKKKSYNLNRS